jgi:putative endonuclease
MPTEGASVYILRCADGSYYVGLTRQEVETRVGEHNSGKFTGYTSARRPVELLWSAHFELVTEAIDTERRLKRWTRAKKEALMRGDFEALRALAARRAR